MSLIPVRIRPEFVWYFSTNRRVYREGEMAGPIWREHWQKRRIVGETRRSWIDEFGAKYDKNGDNVHNEFDLDRKCWAHEHQWRIADEIRTLPVETLELVARTIGYVPEPPK